MDSNDEVKVVGKTPEQQNAIEGIYQNMDTRMKQEEKRLVHAKIPALFKRSAAILRTMAEAVFDLYAYYMSTQQRVDVLEAKMDLLMSTKVLTGTMAQRMAKRQKQLAKQEAEKEAKKKAKEVVEAKAKELEAKQLLADGYSAEPHEDCKHVEGQDHCGHCVKGAGEVEKRGKPDLKIVESGVSQKRESES